MEKTFYLLTAAIAVISILFITKLIAISTFLWIIVPFSFVLMIVGIFVILQTIMMTRTEPSARL